MAAGTNCLPASQRDQSIEELQNKVQQLENTVQQLEIQLKEWKVTSIKGQEEKRGFMYPFNFNSANGLTLRSNQAGESGFYVSLNKAAALTMGKKIFFDTIVTNINNGYNEKTGVFTCPTSGTYLFSLNIACKQGSYLEASIMNGGKNVFNAVCDNNIMDTDISHQSGGSAILSLNANDQIYVEILWPSYGEHAALGKGLTSFSGYLLHPK